MKKILPSILFCALIFARLVYSIINTALYVYENQLYIMWWFQGEASQFVKEEVLPILATNMLLATLFIILDTSVIIFIIRHIVKTYRFGKTEGGGE